MTERPECLTMPFLPEFSGCLVENPCCGFAVRFGFSYHCEHPNHKQFHPTEDSSVARVELPIIYRNLKEARRSQELGESTESDQVLRSAA
jgi:hypothetical protein